MAVDDTQTEQVRRTAGVVEGIAGEAVVFVLAKHVTERSLEMFLAPHLLEARRGERRSRIEHLRQADPHSADDLRRSGDCQQQEQMQVRVRSSMSK